jgi:hypothetical protein
LLKDKFRYINVSFPTFKNHLGILPSMLLLERSKHCNSFWVLRKFGNSCKLQEERYRFWSLVKLAIDFGIGPINLFPLKLKVTNEDEEIFWNVRGPIS